MKDKRQFTRVIFNANIEVIFEKIIFKCALVDISLKGVLASFEKNPFFTIDDECEIKISLSDSDIEMQFFAGVVHINKNMIGFKFRSTDIESLTHLRNLLSYNCGNAEKITNELSFLRNE